MEDEEIMVINIVMNTRGPFERDGESRAGHLMNAHKALKCKIVHFVNIIGGGLLL